MRDQPPFLEGADNINTVVADKQYAIILTNKMAGSGVHINAIGGDWPSKTGLHWGIILRATKTIG